jgi:GAF domain-containing protein
MSDQRARIWDRAWYRLSNLNLGPRLTITLLPLVLIPLLVAVGFTYLRARTILRQQAIDQLSSAAKAQIEVLNGWTEFREQQLLLGSQRSSLVSLLDQYMEPEIIGTEIKDSLRLELEDIQIREGNTVFVEMLVTRTSDGTILVSTNPDWEGESLSHLMQDTFSMEGIKTLPIYDDALISPNTLALVSTSPLRVGEDQEIEILLVGVNSGLRLGALMQEMQIFWEERGVYIVERGLTYLTMAPDFTIRLERYGTGPTVTSGSISPIFAETQVSPSGVVDFTNEEGVSVLAAYEWVEDWDIGVVVELPQEEIFGEINRLAPVISLLLLGAIVLVSFVVPLTTRRALRALGTLTSLAERVALGEWIHRVPETGDDEIGRLGLAFNTMIEELEEIYRSLEERVQERTGQVRTAAEVARDAVAIRDTKTLLDEAVNLISTRFGFYHAGVFIVDEVGENAVLQAASSEGGKRMLQKGHSLPVGKVGIVGYVTGSGNPRIALDVGDDAYHFANPDLPDTRSEIALPLRSGNLIIGALDVQSTEPNAFSEDDLIVLQTMADQLAVAIENARLIENQMELAASRRKVIEIYSRLAQQLSYTDLELEIPRILQDELGFLGVSLGTVEGLDVVVRSAEAVSDDLLSLLGERTAIGRGILGRAVSTLNPIVAVDEEYLERGPRTHLTRLPPTTICVPLITRGHAIGTITALTDKLGESQKRDLEMLELLSGQIAVSLENARLLEETQQSLLQMDALYRQQSDEAWDQLLDRISQREDEAVAEYDSGAHPDRMVDAPALNAPITLHGQTIGTLDLLKSESKTWSEDDQAILEAVAEEVASALEQVRLIEEIQRRAIQLQAAAEIARDSTGILDLDTLVGRAVNLIRERFNLYHVSVYLIDEEQGLAIIQGAAGEASEKLMQIGQNFSVRSSSIIGEVTRSSESYIAHDVATDPYYTPNPLLPETKTELGVPLRLGDLVIGVINVQHSAAYSFSEDEIIVLEILADQLAVAVQNSWNYEAALHRAKQEQAVLEITGKIRASTSVDNMLRTTIQEMRHALSAGRATIRLMETPSEPASSGNDGGKSLIESGESEPPLTEDVAPQEGAS